MVERMHLFSHLYSIYIAQEWEAFYTLCMVGVRDVINSVTEVTDIKALFEQVSSQICGIIAGSPTVSDLCLQS